MIGNSPVFFIWGLIVWFICICLDMNPGVCKVQRLDRPVQNFGFYKHFTFEKTGPFFTPLSNLDKGSTITRFNNI